MTRLDRLIAAITMIMFLQTAAICDARLMSSDLLSQKKIEPKGQYYEATIPDTLDLAERARAAINAMAGIILPEKFYYSNADVIWGKQLTLTPPTWNLACEYLSGFPLARTMCGSTQGLDIELGTIRSYVNGIAEDGVIYNPMDDLGKPKGSAFTEYGGFAGLAVANWYERDGNPLWLDTLTSISRGLEKMAIKREDRAFYPSEYCYLPNGTWVAEKRAQTQYNMSGDAHDLKPFDGTEPGNDQQGFEGAVKYYNAVPLLAFVKSFAYTGDARSRETADRVKRFLLKPALWRNMDMEGYDGVEKGIFGGHFHGNLIPLWALLDLALAENDPALKQLVLSGYEHARRYIASNVGWSPLHMYPIVPQDTYTDGCNVADAALLAVKLTDAGLGDFWDDAESFARNQLAEGQFLDKKKMRAFLSGGAAFDAAIERYWGGFFQTEPTILSQTGGQGGAIIEPGCCMGSGPWGLYAVWHGITRFSNGVATVNMFLNRASAWMDVDSFLPYEGKVVLHNKQAHTALVRLPGWLEANKVKSFVNEQPISPVVVDRHVIFNGLKANDTIRLEFPIKQWTTQINIAGQHTLTFLGLTLIDIQPRSAKPATYPIYEREEMKSTKAPLCKVQRFAADKVIPIP